MRKIGLLFATALRLFGCTSRPGGSLGDNTPAAKGPAPDFDLEIWRYQKYVENPPLAKVDAKPYMAMRKWAQRFYEVPPADAVERR